MPHIDIERLVLNYSYHIGLCIIFLLAAATSFYMSGSSLQSVTKLKINLVNSLRYKLKRKI